MKQLNYKERDIITNTPITRDLFETDKLSNICPGRDYRRAGCMFDIYINYLEELRVAYKNTNDIKYFFTLVSMLPATYKPVRLRESPSYVRRAVSNYQKKKPEKFFKEKYKPIQRAAAKRYQKFKYATDEEYRKKKCEYKKKYYYEHREEILAKRRERRRQEKSIINNK